MKLWGTSLAVVVMASQMAAQAQPEAVQGTAVHAPADILNFSAGFLVQYGFIGVALLLLAIGWFTRAKNTYFALASATLGVAFLAFYGVVTFCLAYFPDAIVKPDSFLAGELDGVPTAVQVTMRANDQHVGAPFIRVENDLFDDGYRNYLFMFQHKQPVSCFTVYYSYPPAADRKEHTLSFNVDHLDSLGTNPSTTLMLSLTGEGEAVKLALKRLDMAGKTSPESDIAPLEHESSTDHACGGRKHIGSTENTGTPHTRYGFDIRRPASWLGLLVGSALAQPGRDPNQAAFALALKSDDPVVRRSARDDLADYGAKAVPLIKAFLQSHEYRLMLGSTEAIRGMAPDTRSAVIGAVGPEIQALRTNSDKTLAESASAALGN